MEQYDFHTLITDLVKRISNEKALRRVWRILKYAYIDELKGE